jgi:hypothetical protein
VRLECEPPAILRCKSSPIGPDQGDNGPYVSVPVAELSPIGGAFLRLRCFEVCYLMFPANLYWGATLDKWPGNPVNLSARCLASQTSASGDGTLASSALHRGGFRRGRVLAVVRLFTKRMDARVKPAHDGPENRLVPRMLPWAWVPMRCSGADRQASASAVKLADSVNLSA